MMTGIYSYQRWIISVKLLLVFGLANRLCGAKIKICLNKGSSIYMKTENVNTGKNGGIFLLSLCKLLMVYFFKESAMKGRASGGLVVW